MGLNGSEDNETLKRTVRALREELARVHGNLRAQTARADLYLRKLQALTYADDNDEEYKKMGDNSQRKHKHNFTSPPGVIVLNDPGYLHEGFSPLSVKNKMASARGPIFGKINTRGHGDVNTTNGTSHAGV